MDIVTEIVKFLGTVIATVVAVASVYFPDTKTVDAGGLTAKGKWLVTAAISGLLLSAGAQVTQMIDARTTAEAVRQRNEVTAARLERIPLLIERSSLPMEPLELLFTLEYPMDQPVLEGYTRRLQSDIVSYLREHRRHRGSTSDDLTQENMLFFVNNREEWQPKDTDEERGALQLISDGTMFHFLDSGSVNKREINFMSAPPGMEDALVTMPKRGELVQLIKLKADFKRRLFIKSVTCRNPIRSGSDSRSFSALDLVGRNLTWSEGIVSGLKWTLVSFAIRFSFDYGFSQNFEEFPPKHEIIPSGKLSVTVTADNVGLGEVVMEK